MMTPIFRIIKKRFPSEGRCVHCDAKGFCAILPGTSRNRIRCECKIDEHYIDIKKERREKLKKIENEIIK